MHRPPQPFARPGYRVVHNAVQRRHHQVHGHQRVVVRDQNAGVLHQFAIGHPIAEGGVFDDNDQLRDQRRDDVADGLRKDDGEEHLRFGHAQAVRGVGLAGVL